MKSAYVAHTDSSLDESELHIKLVVHDPEAVGELRLAAAELRRRALQAPDTRTSSACIEACDRILAIADVYAHLRTLTLQREVELVQNLPQLCGELCACFGDGLWPPQAIEEDFAALSLMRPDGVVGPLITGAMDQSAPDHCCDVCFSLTHNAAGEWVISSEAAPQPIAVNPAASHRRWVDDAKALLRDWIGRTPRLGFAGKFAPAPEPRARADASS